MPDTATYLLLAAATATAVTIYMFDPKAPPKTHSQPKFIQANQPGFTPYKTKYNSKNDLPVASVVMGRCSFGW
jgi:hypothetical protein